MKVAVITLHAVKNYGSVLQTYATQKKLEEFGCDVEIINYVREQNRDENLIKTWTEQDKGPKKLAKSLVLSPTVHRWKKIFWDFLYKYVNISPTQYYSGDEIVKAYPDFDIYCTGSDQVWNSTWNKGFIPEFFLTFAPEGSKRIAFSASIGKSELEENEKEQMREALLKYDAISVREDTAVQILNGLGIQSTHISDPTLLLPKKFWQDLASPRIVQGNYVLIYQLNHNRKFDEYALKFAKQKGCKLIRLCTRYDQARLPGKGIYLPTPKEFLSLLTHASYIITDSFHATAFALNLNTEVICVYPNNFSSRINDLLEAVNLENRHLTDFSDYQIANNPTDFSFVNNYLLSEREKATTFLKAALS